MSACLRPYPEYKDAGLPWLDTIPTGWTVRRGKGIFSCIDVRSATGGEELLTVSSKSGVVPRRTATVTMFKAESYVGHKLCWPADLVINSLWAWAGGLGFARHHGIVSTAYGVYRLRPELASYWRYFDYLLRSTAYHWELHVRSKGVWTSRLQMTDQSFLDMPMLLPNPDEADAICRFLDAADQRFNRLIRTKRRLIELLQEQKQAVIHRAVTRGLDPDVRLKPSGTGSDLFGDIPEHWQMLNLKKVASNIVDCLHATPTYDTNASYPAIRTADVEPGVILVSQAKRLNEEQYQKWVSRLKPQAGDIVYSREGERYGIAALVPPDTELCISQRMMLFRIKPEFDSEYIMWQLNSPPVYRQASDRVYGSAAPHVNVEQIRNFALAIPPLAEQREISAVIKSETVQISTAIGKAREETKLIREYRTRLIADVVTGKLDVRGVALPELDEVELEDEVEDVEDGESDETNEDEEAEE